MICSISRYGPKFEGLVQNPDLGTESNTAAVLKSYSLCQGRECPRGCARARRKNSIPGYEAWLTRQTITAFLASVLTKKYNNASSDIINVLAGLDEVDAVFTDFVAALDITIRTGHTRRHLNFGTEALLTKPVETRQKAIEVALAVVSGAYQTSLLSYFTHRDLFPSLMKVSNPDNS